MTQRRDTLSASLLDDLWTTSLDPAYLEAAGRRAALVPDAPAQPGEHGRRRLARSVRSAVTFLVVGVFLAVGIAQVHRQVRGDAQARSALLAQVRARDTADAALTERLSSLRAAVTGERAATLATTGAGTVLSHRLDQLQLATAAVAVTGPGVVVRLSDAAATPGPVDSSAAPGPPAPTPAATVPPGGRVTDRNLQQLVNALWAAGAEAISINGERLGPQSAIRTAGEAVLVDFRPVSSPYEVAAVGNRDSLQTGLADSAAAAGLRTLGDVAGITFSVRGDDRLQLAAAAVTEPREATAVARVSATPATSP